MAKRRWIWITLLAGAISLGCTILLGIAAGAATPWFLSTKTGKDWLITSINSRIPGTIELQKLKLSWTGTCELFHLRILDDQNHPILSIEHATLANGLLGRIQGRSLTQASISGGALHLELDRRGISNLERALGLVDILQCRSPRPTSRYHPVEIDHVEFDLRPRGGIPELVSSALCHHAGVEGSWRVNARFLDQGDFPSDYDLEAHKIPVEILELTSNLSGRPLYGAWSLLLGDSFDLLGAARTQEVLSGNLTLHSPQLHAEWTLSGPPHQPRLALTKPATWALDPMTCTQLLRELWGQPQLQPKSACSLRFAEASYELGGNGALQGTLTAPFELTGPQDSLQLRSLECEALLVGSQVSLAFSAEGQSGSEPIQAGMHAQTIPLRGSFSAHGLPVWLLRALAPAWAGVTTPLGNRLALEATLSPEPSHPWHIRGTFSGKEDTLSGLPLVIQVEGTGHDDELVWKAEVSAPRLEMTSHGDMRWRKSFHAAETRWTAQINRTFLEALGVASPQSLGQQNVPVEGAFKPFQIDLCEGTLGELQTTFQATPVQLNFDVQKVQVEGLEGKVHWSPSQHSASLQLHADLLTQGQKRAPLGISGVVHHLEQRPSYEARFDCPALPVLAISRLIPKLEGLDALLGSTLAVKGDLNVQQGGDHGTVDLQFRAPGLEGHLPLSWGDQWELADRQTAQLTARLSPEAAKPLQQWLALPSQLTLDSTLQAKLVCTALKWPRTERGSPELQASLTLSPFSLKRRDRPGKLMIREGQLTVQKIGTTEGPLSCSGRLETEVGGVQGSVILSATGHPNNLWRSLTGELQLQHFPVEAFHLALASDEAFLEDLLGEHLSSIVKVVPQGEHLTWTFGLRSPYLQAASSGTVEPAGAVRFTKPWLATWTVSPELTESHFQQFAGLAHSLIPGQWMALRVEPEGSLLNWRDPLLKALVLPQVTLDVGHVQIASTSFTQGMMGFLKSRSARTLDLWTTPLYFSIHHEDLSLQRVDALLNGSMEVALWGGLKLDTGALSMQLGLSAGALSFAFTITNLPNNGFYTVGVTGTLMEPRVDWGAAAARLAVMSASKFSLGGVLLGSALDTMTGGNVPPPTTKTLPWRASQPTSVKEEIARQLKTTLTHLGLPPSPIKHTGT